MVRNLDTLMVRTLGAIFMALFSLSVKILWSMGSDLNEMKLSMAKVAVQLEVQSEISQDHESRIRRLEAPQSRR